MTVVLLHGHGGWAPSDGYTQMPANCSISFFTHFAKLLNQTMAKGILQNTHTQDFDRTIGEYQSVPNATLSSLQLNLYNWANANFVPGGRVLYMLNPHPAHQKFHLSDLMPVFTQAWGKDTKIDFQWVACQSLKLDKVGGRALGVNASDRTVQTGHEGEYLFKWVDENGNKQQKYVKSNSSIHN